MQNTTGVSDQSPPADGPQTLGPGQDPHLATTAAYGYPATLLAIGLCLCATLAIISQYNYLLFHSLAELFSIAVAWSVFLLVFNARRFIDNDALMVLGTALLFIGMIDLLHTLAYKGMGVFQAADEANLATQLWIAARYMESLSLLFFAFLIGRTVRLAMVTVAYAVVTLLVFVLIFFWPVFPECFNSTAGLTPFKIGSEYVICFILFLSLILLVRKQSLVQSQVYLPMVAAILLTIIGELAFTFYFSVYGLSNLVGHLAKILSCLLIYQALIRSGLTQPYEVLFTAWQKAQEDFRQLVESAPISIMRFDSSGSVTYVNPFHLKTFGAGKHAAGYFIGQKIHELPGIVHAGISEQVAQVLKGVPVILPNVYFPRFTGGHAGHQSIKAVPFIKDDIVTGGLLLREDISPIIRHEQRFASAVATTSDGFWILDQDGKIQEVNHAAARMLHYTPEELNGMTIQDIDAVETESVIRQRLEKIRQIGHDRFESRHRRRDGHLVDVEVSVSFLPDMEQVFVIFTRDISEKKHSEERLALSEAKFATAFNHNPIPMSISNLDDDTYIDVNDAFVRVTGYSKMACVGKTSTEIGFLDSATKQRLANLLIKHRRLEGEVLNLRKKDGSHLVCEYWGEIISIGDRLRLISIAHDITARKRAEWEREASERLLRLINQQKNLKQLIQETAGMLRHWSGCQAVGIRMIAKNGLANVAALGFTADMPNFEMIEKSPPTGNSPMPHPRDNAFLMVMGARVLNADSEPEKEYFTEGGSFWTNSISELILPVAQKTSTGQSHVTTHPYESVAMVPLRFGNDIMGLVVFCDLRTGLFSSDTLSLFERLASKLSIAIKERLDVEALQKSERKYRSLVENAPVGIFTTTSNGRVISANPEMVRIVGMDNTQDAQNHFTDLSRQLYASPKRRNDFLNELSTHGQVKGFEYEAISATGKHLWLRMDARVEETLADGGFTIEGFSIDITHRKRMEQLLQARLQISEYADTHSLQKVLQRTLDEAETLTNSQIGFFHFVDDDQQTIHLQMWSSTTLRGICKAEGFERRCPVEKAGVWADCLRQRQTVVHNDYPTLAHRKGLPPGHPPVFRELLIPVIRDDRVVAILGMGNKPSDYSQDDIDVASELVNMAWDIVVRRHAEKDLLDSRRDLQTLVANLPGIAFRCKNDPSWTMLYIGGNCHELTGHAPEDFIDNRKLAFVDIIHAEDREPVDNTVQTALKASGHYEIEYRMVDAQGTLKWVWERGQALTDAISGQPIVEGFITDITDRKQNEEQLKLQAMVLDQIHDRVLVTDLEGRITYANRLQRESFGFSNHDLIGQKTEVFGSDPEYGASQAEIINHTLADGSWHGEVANYAKNGTLHIMDCRTKVVRDAKDNAIALFGISTDITEQRKWENELRRLASVIEQAAESIMITDPDGIIVFVNPSFERITGYDRHEVVGKTPGFLKSGEQGPHFYQEMWEALKAGRTFSGSFTNRKKDGSFYIEKGTISPVFNEKGTLINYVAVRNDVTEEMRLEEKLGQAQKMEAIGTLAGGIAHDFNNILFPMVGYAEMLKEDLADGSPQQEYVADILSAALRARDLVQQILAFSRQSHQERIPIRVQQVLKEAVKLTRASLPSDIRVDVDIDTQCPAVMADPTQIHQIVMNLITNAYHAMEEGGVLTISLGTTVLDGAHPDKPTLPGGTYVCLKVADTGHGIDPIIQERIFEPYFTTKAEGKGTGLGLSVIHGIVTSCQGEILMESEPGKGAVFIVYLPVVKTSSKGETQHEKISIPGGSERILLVDDEAPVVGMVNKMLQRLGYAVTTRTSSTEALEAFKANPNRFDLVVTDMTMPGMTGDQLTIEIKRIRPDMPVILCTGFSNRIDESRAAEIGIQGFVLKPILRQDIAETIRRVLDDQ